MNLLDEMSYKADFVPKGCNTPRQRAIRFGAGITLAKAYKFAHEHKSTIVGGDDGQIGVAGGWIMVSWLGLRTLCTH